MENIEHPTSNDLRFGCSLDVGCWMLDVPGNQRPKQRQGNERQGNEKRILRNYSLAVHSPAFPPSSSSVRCRQPSSGSRYGLFLNAGFNAGWVFKTTIISLFVACSVLLANGADKPEPPPAKLKISGYGLVGNLRLKRTIKLLEFQTKKPQFLEANFVEDSALILRSKLRDDGYLAPAIAVSATLEDGRELTFDLRDSIKEPLPRPLRAREVKFQIKEGVFYRYTRIEFEGLDVMPAKAARAYFVETTGIIALRRNRVYSPDRLKRSLSNLAEALERLGFQEAGVTVADLKQDDQTGEVALRIRVKQGPKSVVRSVRQETYLEGTNAPAAGRTNQVFQPYSKSWEQDFVRGIKTNYYHRGYPETAVDVRAVTREPTNGAVLLDLLASVRSGPRIRTGDIKFRGNTRTKDSLLEHRVALKEGGPLDRVKAEHGQYRLARLGIFESVELKYEPTGSNVWNVSYDVKEGKRVDVSPLFGFGSYDLLRAGIEMNQHNLWGLAHGSRLRLIQSFKSSSGDYTYTMPELLGEDVDVFVTGSGLRREEISFTRTEFGGGAGVRRFFRELNTDASLRYNYGILQATETSINFAEEGAQNPTVGELIADIRHDRRDNPLYPRRGYQLLANIELATEYLGGNANFQRVELAASWHVPLNNSEWLHVGLRHGVVSTIGATSQDLPFTRRFFPGGENSVRGYREGEASPRDEEGKIVGAETYLSGNFEFEQALTPKWSLVGFVDGVGFARRLNDYPGNEVLFSAGAGVRWRTIIGPVRLEYGHNLNPRPGDPSGTVQFSLGFPF